MSDDSKSTEVISDEDKTRLQKEQDEKIGMIGYLTVVLFGFAVVIFGSHPVVLKVIGVFAFIASMIFFAIHWKLQNFNSVADYEERQRTKIKQRRVNADDPTVAMTKEEVNAQWESILTQLNEPDPAFFGEANILTEHDFGRFIDSEIPSPPTQYQDCISNINLYESLLRLPIDTISLDFYQLLGVERFCSDAQLIRNAMLDKYGTFLGLQNSPDFQDIKILMMMLAEAKLVLFDPEKKAAYDRQLRIDSNM